MKKARAKIVFFSLFLILFDIKAQEMCIEKTGDIIRIGLPASAFVLSFVLENEKEGILQATASFGATFISTHLIKRIIDKDRPEGEKYAFPSGHTSISFSAAAFVQKRYGFNYGIPFYFLAGYVGWSRVYVEKHDWWDVLGGVVIGIGCSYLFTDPCKENKVKIIFKNSEDFYMAGIAYKF